MNEVGIGYLLKSIKGKDADGYDSEITTETEVFLEKKSVRRTEHYSAMQAGMKPSVIFRLRLPDYELTRSVENGKETFATKVQYDGVVYDILRVYAEDTEYIELTCG